MNDLCVHNKVHKCYRLPLLSQYQYSDKYGSKIINV